MKKKRKHINKRASRNALNTNEPKKRFGKRQKRKLIIIAVLVFVVSISLNFVVKHYQGIKLEEANKARKGKLIEKNIPKPEYDKEGNIVKEHNKTEVHVINIGDGSAILVKKGRMDVLIDAGNEKVVNYLKKHIDGDLDYIITTSDADGSISGLAAVVDNIKYNHYLYNANHPSLRINGEKIDGQIIDMGENLVIQALPGRADTDSAIVTVTDGDEKFIISGTPSVQNMLTAKLGDEETIRAIIVGGKPNTENMSIADLNQLNPQYIIVSSGKKLSTDFIEGVSKANADLYATYKSKTIIFTIDGEEATINADSETALRYEETEKPEKEESVNTDSEKNKDIID